ncbi:MAG TPA: D-alanyl-D-alanine carboxypeptidase/D-alanyl-D-alanine-endopeptidase [Candidatus Acidoferrum sp.]|jgi:D-alanyl-D-alanine carboxypeptidase/D-alanyl-D-alanine-endopeptidase (penicillin-binding protein 4)|nr:D-alanyl-D-alanine carboxypeptidase/D-alanyl-D-alanine-endopeptidase [Candidatus Acidoferrum sp.]
MSTWKILERWAAASWLTAVCVFAQQAQKPAAPAKSASAEACCGAKRPSLSARKATARFAGRASALLGTAPTGKGEWGLLVVDAQSGETLYEQNADKYFVPASNMKLFTTALALEKLGPDYRFRTTLETSGTISSAGVLTGDLVLVGRGDPNLSNRKFPYELKEEFEGPTEKAFVELADALAAKGVREISGDVIGDDSYFPRERYPNGWEIDDMVWEYGAAISAIVVDDNTVALTLTPGDLAGSPVQAAVSPATPDFLVENRVVTSAAELKSDLTLKREPGANLVVVKGSLPAKSAPRKLVLAIEEPAQHAATLLKHLLEERGVKIAGVARARHDSGEPYGDPTVLAEHVSVPLGDAVKLINKISQNLHAEMLLRTVARQNGVWATPDDLVKVPADFYTAAGIATDDVIQTDASGLSRHDLVTPRAVVTLLSFAEKQPWFGPFYRSLPVAGTDGTLEDRMKNTIAVGKIHAKTGSVEHVRTLSGFAETPAGRLLLFSFLSNNQGGKSHEAADAMTGLCVAMLEEFNVAPPRRAVEHHYPQ